MSTAKRTRKPLRGLKILDFSAVYAGPICTRMLADCGAEVLKVETPGAGDITRSARGMSRIFAHFNVGKSSIAIDLKSKSGQSLARQLAKKVDVLVENFRPGVMAKFGLDYDSLAADCPNLIYCSLSGFGQAGPFVSRAAYAPIAQAASGFDFVHQECQDGAPERPHNSGIMIADILTGSYAFGAVQTALLGRAQSGVGENIDVTMLESMLTLIPPQLQNSQLPSPAGPRSYRSVRVKDGFVMACIISGKNLEGLAKAMKRPDLLTDDRFSAINRARNPQVMVTEIETWSIQYTALECEQALNQCGVPCSVYNAPAELFDHPQIAARDSFAQLEDEHGEFLVQNVPFQFANADLATGKTVASLGQHTDQILTEQLNLSQVEITALRDASVVA
ncbi:MAG: CoA transferase [Pseudomonadales bacterium]|nr:CoA transferase [Pseudomonadales bacterium]